MRTDLAVGSGGPALFRLVRFWSRRWAPAPVPLLEAIDAAQVDGTAAINDVAVELGLDRSNASRMLADAVRDGLVTKAAAPDDARRAVLGLTDDGRAMLADARAWQAERFAELVADWPVRDARRFAGYLVRLAEGTR
jgi:DNA-binding MarR family transcriptional regulator